jgi:hypothetical protein
MPPIILILAGLWYFLCCGFVSDIAGKRGHNGSTAFFVCLFFSPLIAAIIYSPYKQETKETKP